MDSPANILAAAQANAQLQQQQQLAQPPQPPQLPAGVTSYAPVVVTAEGHNRSQKVPTSTTTPVSDDLRSVLPQSLQSTQPQPQSPQPPVSAPKSYRPVVLAPHTPASPQSTAGALHSMQQYPPQPQHPSYQQQPQHPGAVAAAVPYQQQLSVQQAGGVAPQQQGGVPQQHPAGATVSQVQSTLHLLEAQLLQSAWSGQLHSVPTLAAMIAQQVSLGAVPLPYLQEGAAVPRSAGGRGRSRGRPDGGDYERRKRSRSDPSRRHEQYLSPPPGGHGFPPGYNQNTNTGAGTSSSSSYHQQQPHHGGGFQQQHPQSTAAWAPRSAATGGPLGEGETMSPQDAELHAVTLGIEDASWNYKFKRMHTGGFSNLSMVHQQAMHQLTDKVRRYLLAYPDKDYANAGVAKKMGVTSSSIPEGEWNWEERTMKNYGD